MPLWARRRRPATELARAPRVIVHDDEHARRDAALTLALWRLRTTDEPTPSVLDDYVRQVTST